MPKYAIVIIMKCKLCEQETNWLVKHHIQPKSRGGTNDPENIIKLCYGCHWQLHKIQRARNRKDRKLEPWEGKFMTVGEFIECVEENALTYNVNGVKLRLVPRFYAELAEDKETKTYLR